MVEGAFRNECRLRATSRHSGGAATSSQRAHEALHFVPLDQNSPFICEPVGSMLVKLTTAPYRRTVAFIPIELRLLIVDCGSAQSESPFSPSERGYKLH